jgi:N-acetylneuraminic acid mutarotase
MQPKQTEETNMSVQYSRRNLLIAGAAGGALAAFGMGPKPAHAQQAKWGFAPALPKAMGELAGVAVGNSMYAMAGLDDADHTPYGMVYRYDGAAPAWTTMRQMALPAHHIAVTAMGGKIYVFGGFVRPSAFIAWQPIANAWEYDPQKDSWRALAPLPRPRGSAQAVAVGGKIYVIGGACSNARDNPAAPILRGSPAHTVVGYVDEYDAATDSWRPRSPMPTPRNHYLAAEVGGKIYAVNGRIGAVFVTMSDVIDLVEEYDPATDQWTLKGRTPTNRGDVAGGAFNGRIYVTGGEYQDTQRKMSFWAVEAFNPAANTWDALPHLQVARHGCAAAFMGNQLHVVGGSFQSDGMPGSASPTSSHEVFEVAT